MKRKLSRLSVLALVVTLSACAARAPNLTPRATLIYDLNEAVIAIGAVQSAAISLNTTAVCAPPTATAPPKCTPILSDANTRLVVDTVTSTLQTLRSVPAGSKATILKALDVIDGRLDAAGRDRLRVYVSAARTIALGLLGAS